MWNFAANKKVQDLNKVPDNLRVFYEEVDGNWQLRSDEVTTAAVSVMTGQDNALRAVRKEADDAKKVGQVDLSELSDYGSTPAEIKEAVDKKIAELAEASKGAESAKAQIDKIKKEANEAHQRALTEKDQALASMETQVNAYILTSEVQAAVATKFPGANPKLLMPFVTQSLGITVEETEGRKVRQVIVKDADGSPRYSRSAERAGERMGVSELLEEMSKTEEYGALFPSKARTGSDSKTSSGPVHPGIRQKPDNMSSHDKIKAGLEARQK